MFNIPEKLMSQSREKSKKSTFLWQILKITVTGSAIYWFASTVEWHGVIDGLKQVNLTMLMVAFMVFVLRLVPCSLRWKKVGQTSGYSISFGQSFYGYMVGGFFNTFLPTGRGGDAARAIIIARKCNLSLGGIMGTIFVERFVGLLVTVIIALGAGYVASTKIVALQNALPSIIFLTLILVVLGIIFLSPWFQKLYHKIVGKLPFQKFWKSIADMLDVFHIYRKSPKAITWVVLYSLLNQVIFIFSGYLVAKAIFGFNAPWTSFPIVIPLIFIAELLPSIGGYGIREAGYVFFFGWFGVSPEAAVIFGILQLVFLWTSALVGAIFFVLDSPGDKPVIKDIQKMNTDELVIK